MSTATAPQKQSAPKRYEMPPVELGDIVVWYPDSGSRDCEAAIVSAVGFENICVNVIASNNATFRLRDGVRHVSDPKEGKEANEGGRWDYTPREKRLMEVLGELQVTTTEKK